jgi:hypothetical protein
MAAQLSKSGERIRMANPQPVPFVRFSKELFDALLLSPMPATHKELVLAVIRRTYGDHGAKAAPISQSLLQAMTGRARSGVRTCMDDLVREGVLLQVAPPSYTSSAVLKLNKNYEKWGKWSVRRVFVGGEGQELAQGQLLAQGQELEEGQHGGPIEDYKNSSLLQREERAVVSRAKTTKPTTSGEVPKVGAQPWVADWVTALLKNGDDAPTKGAREIFGAKCKVIGDIDPYIMKDCIERMVHESKHPGVLHLVYGDCARLTERETFETSIGGRRVR